MGERDAVRRPAHLEEPGARQGLVRLWPIAKSPVPVDGDRTIVETSIIIEHPDRLDEA